MVGIIWLIVVIVVIVNVMKNSQKEKEADLKRKREAAMRWSSQGMNGAAPSPVSQPVQSTVPQRTVTDADRAKLEAYRQKKAASAAPSQMPEILRRAEANSKKYAKDETLHSLETEHKHSERVAPAVAAYVEKEREEHMRMHTQPRPAIEETSLLGSVEDLMVKGYDGNLSFERDFIGEATDLLNSFGLR